MPRELQFVEMYFEMCNIVCGAKVTHDRIYSKLFYVT